MTMINTIVYDKSVAFVGLRAALSYSNKTLNYVKSKYNMWLNICGGFCQECSKCYSDEVENIHSITFGYIIDCVSYLKTLYTQYGTEL